MNMSPELERELHQLVGNLLNDQITDDEFKRLDEILSADESARQLYISYVDVNSFLPGFAELLEGKASEEPISSISPTPLAGNSAISVDQQLSAGQSSDLNAPLIYLQSDTHSSAKSCDGVSNPTLPIPSSNDDCRLGNSQTTLWSSFHTGTGRILFFVLILSLVGASFAIRYGQNSRDDVVGTSNPKITTPNQTSFTSHQSSTATKSLAFDGSIRIARVTNAWDTVWGSGSSALKVNDLLHAGQRLELNGGLVEITFECGAIAIVQAPAVFIVEAHNGGVLESGRMTARVPGPTAKFWVTTPTMKIIDLGTEFGISADTTSGSQVRVFEGAVEIEPLTKKKDKDSSPNSAIAIQSERRLITAGQVGLVKATKDFSEQKASVETDATYVRDMPNSFVDDFSQRIRSSRPWGYWSFNSVITSTLIPDMSGHGRFAQLINDAMVVQGNSVFAIGQAVSLKESNMDSIMVPTGTSLSLQKDFSLEVIFRTTEGGVLMSKVPADGGWAPGSKILFIRGGEVRFGACDSKNMPSSRAFSSKDLINDNRWHHAIVVNKANFSRSADLTIMYIDGVERARRNNWRISSDNDKKMPFQLGVGSLKYPSTELIKTTHFPTHTHFSGQIDEAAAYERCLTADEVAAHYRAFLTIGIHRRNSPPPVVQVDTDDGDETDENISDDKPKPSDK